MAHITKNLSLIHICLVEEMFNASLNRVVINNNEGKIENSNGSFIYKVTNIVVMDNAILRPVSYTHLDVYKRQNTQ